jgi:hypothetical protein
MRVIVMIRSTDPAPLEVHHEAVEPDATFRKPAMLAPFT